MKEAFGNYPLQKITPVVLNDYFVERTKQLAGTSLIKHKAILHNIFKMALHEGRITSNPIERTVPIKTKRPEVRALTAEEAQRLLSAAKEYFSNPVSQILKQMYPIIYLALATGLRRGEILGLLWQNIDDGQNRISIVQALVEVKGGTKVDSAKSDSSVRTISLDRKIINLLLTLKEPDDRPTDFVFHTQAKGFIIPSNLNRAFNTIRKKANINIRFHDTRHTHATMLIGHGIDMKTVSARLGHKDITTTLNKYTHVIKEVDELAAERAVSLINFE
jgi:integrase